MRRRTCVAVIAVTAVLALAGCGSQDAAGGASPSGSLPSVTSSGSTPPPPGTDPVSLVGSWLVRGNAAVEDGTVLRISDDLSLWASCGYVMGGWRADHHGLFVGHIDGGDGGCMPKQGDPTPAWLTTVSRYAPDGDGFLLQTADGTTVARLAPGGRPTPGSNLLPSLADPPTVTDQLRAALAPGVGLPSALTPATPAGLVGRWKAVAPTRSDGFVRQTPPGATLTAAGGYSATDGCNQTSGRWAASDAGSFVATGGASTLVGCDNIDVGGWLAQATDAGFTGTTLVLVDHAGHELGRLTRA
jgi:hypothetical protein